MALPDDAFIAELQSEFGDRAGNFSNPTTRKCYPLAHGKVSNPVGQRLVTIGNAAHTVHPVAGQGFNLGLRDVAVLAELILHASQNQQDIGSASMLEHYAALRQRETWMVNGFTDGLISLFCNRHKPVEMARNLVLKGVELCPPAKRFLLKRTMGLTGKSSRPGAGLPRW
jgi:2-octaprenyl-6-methoxyphenol hydroxylase